MISKTKFTYPITGLALGLAGTLMGISLSSTIDAGPATYGSTCAVWFAVGAAVLSSYFRTER